MIHCWISVWGKQLRLPGGSRQAIHACDQDIYRAAVLQAVQNRKPELHAFVLSNIHTENVLVTIHINPDRDINRTLYNPAFIPYMVMDRIHENDCIDLFQRPFAFPAILLRWEGFYP